MGAALGESGGRGIRSELDPANWAPASEAQVKSVMVCPGTQPFPPTPQRNGLPAREKEPPHLAARSKRMSLGCGDGRSSQREPPDVVTRFHCARISEQAGPKSSNYGTHYVTVRERVKSPPCVATPSRVSPGFSEHPPTIFGRGEDPHHCRGPAGRGEHRKPLPPQGNRPEPLLCTLGLVRIRRLRTLADAVVTA